MKEMKRFILADLIIGLLKVLVSFICRSYAVLESALYDLENENFPPAPCDPSDEIFPLFSKVLVYSINNPPTPLSPCVWLPVEDILL